MLTKRQLMHIDENQEEMSEEVEVVKFDAREWRRLSMQSLEEYDLEMEILK